VKYDPVQETASLITRVRETIRVNEEHLARLRLELRVARNVHGLKLGMSLEQARALLRGWTASPKLMTAATQVLSQWDFLPPDGGADPLRLTFGDGKLLLWGTPAGEQGQIAAPPS
jgi:hypothetical protein